MIWWIPEASTVHMLGHGFLHLGAIFWITKHDEYDPTKVSKSVGPINPRYKVYFIWHDTSERFVLSKIPTLSRSPEFEENFLKRHSREGHSEPSQTYWKHAKLSWMDQTDQHVKTESSKLQNSDLLCYLEMYFYI